MKKQLSISFHLVLLICVMQACYGKNLEPLRLLQPLEQFRKKNNLGYQDIHDMTFDLALSQRAMPKGGVGTLGNEVYVHTRSEFNELVINGRSVTGKRKNVPQIMLTDGSKILSCDALKDRDLIIVEFFPDRIYFINYKNKIAGYYDREKNDEP